MAVFLFVSVALLTFYGFTFGIGKQKLSSNKGILGGPVVSAQVGDVFSEGFFNSQPALALSILGGNAGITSFNRGEDYIEISSGVVSDPGQPLGSSARGNVLSYRVQPGDTLSGIASYFGVSLDTIINANPGVRARFIKAGDNLNILPISGVVYTTTNNDTLESISAYFGVSENKIMQFNKGIDFGKLGVGTSIVIPGITSFRLAQARKGSLPSFSNQFKQPAEGFNWGRLHNHNAVDIANSCGTPVYSAAEGLVMPDENFGDGLSGWNGGYGKFVFIEHPFGDGVRTRYSHMSSVDVNIGEYVEQGEKIGTIGQSGDSTGCHLHFEVYGASNPLER